MPIRTLFGHSKLTTEQQQVLELAFERTLRQLSLVDRKDPVCDIVARKIIEVGATAGPDEVAISEAALREFQQEGWRDATPPGEKADR